MPCKYIHKRKTYIYISVSYTHLDVYKRQLVFCFHCTYDDQVDRRNSIIQELLGGKYIPFPLHNCLPLTLRSKCGDFQFYSKVLEQDRISSFVPRVNKVTLP